MQIPFVPSYLVFAMGYYSRLCTTVGFYLSRAITMCMSALVSLSRFEEFLLYTEFKHQNYNNSREALIKVTNMSASWSKYFDPESFSLSDITLEASGSALVAIVGPTGSGKSSLLLALMREMESIKGKLKHKICFGLVINR